MDSSDIVVSENGGDGEPANTSDPPSPAFYVGLFVLFVLAVLLGVWFFFLRKDADEGLASDSQAKEAAKGPQAAAGEGEQAPASEPEGEGRAAFAGKRHVVNLAPDAGPGDFAALRSQYAEGPGGGEAETRVHCGNACDMWERPNELRGYRFHSAGACGDLPFHQRTFTHVNVGNRLRIPTPFGRGTYKITLYTGDCAHPTHNFPRLSADVGGASPVPLITNADASRVDRKVSTTVVEGVRVEADTVAIFDPRTAATNRGTASETVVGHSGIVQPTRLAAVMLERTA